MKEWNNPWNPFNSAKALMWREWFEGFAKGEYLPPVTVDTDPCNKCNFDCIWCNASNYMEGCRKEISRDQLFRLSDFYAEWGANSTCVAGGGEPMLNKNTPDFLTHLRHNGVEPGLITNGSLIDDRSAEIIAKNCRWIGFSMDAGTPSTFNKIKGLPLSSDWFEKVLKNIHKVIEQVRRYESNCDVCYKYLLHPLNAREIYKAATLAKHMGVQDFHLRPVGWDNVPKTAGTEPPDYTGLFEEIDDQIARAMELEDENFRFFGIRHKFKPNFERKVDFGRCWAAPLILTFGADGNCHLCFDMRGREDLILCRHDPDPHEVLKHWNSPRHKKMVAEIDIEKCPRCTFGAYNKIVEEVFINDSMCRYFP
jgi:MoaA/NifB/PqqE/SkfB family radical SAM enzyme